MSCKRKKEIQKYIDSILEPSPPKNFIITYNDFLKNRDSLPFYQFNSEVFIKLITLTINKWKSEERISRISLLKAIKKYSIKVNNGKIDIFFNQNIATLNLNMRKKLFTLYKTIWENSEFLTILQREEAFKTINLLLVNVTLEESEEVWFCDNYYRSEFILNRLLRYPKKSPIISNWAKRNFHNDNLRLRRAELASLVINDNPDFEVSCNILRMDYEYLNKFEKKKIKEFIEDMKIYNLFQETEIDYFDLKAHQQSLEYPELKLSKRFYKVPTILSEEVNENLPDFTKLEYIFIENLKLFQQLTMIWALGYSKISEKKKSELLIKYYSSEAEVTFIKVCKKFKIVPPLEWLLCNINPSV